MTKQDYLDEFKRLYWATNCPHPDPLDVPNDIADLFATRWAAKPFNDTTKKWARLQGKAFFQSYMSAHKITLAARQYVETK